MKKQILILVFLVMATFASVNKSYGQTCTPGALNPAAGVDYDYEVAVTGNTTTGAIYNWYVTQNVNILAPTVAITPGTDFAVVATAGYSLYNTAVAAGTTNKIKLNWTPAAIANGGAYYLVVKYTETGTAGCTVDNMKAWQIKPINTFLLAIAGSDLTGDIAKNNTCPPVVDGATITASATAPTVAYTYGQTIISYKVTATGSNGTWTPSLSLPALAGDGQNYNAAEWSLNGSTNWNTFGLTDGDLDGGSFTSTVTTAPVTVLGATIIVRVKIDNVNYESTALQAIIAGIDGVLPGGIKDIKTLADCADEVDFGKTGTYTVNARPAIAETTPSGAGNLFITKNP